MLYGATPETAVRGLLKESEKKRFSTKTGSRLCEQERLGGRHYLTWRL